MVWREPQNLADDCCGCLTNITGFKASSRKRIKYPNLRSAMRPVPHSDDLPVATPPVNKDLLSSSDEGMPSREDCAESISLEDIESTYSGTSGNEPHWITQEELNDLARDLYLSKQQSELLTSLLKQWNLVQEDHQFQESEQIRLLVFLWVCKRASQSTVVLPVSGIVELYPSITSRKTGSLEALLFLANAASRKILWWTWIRCFFLLFTLSLVWWRISRRRCTKIVLPSNTCVLWSQVLVLLSSKRASLSDLRSVKCWRILILRGFLT